MGWIGADRQDALAGLARKLPHYGKYSYLAFAGSEPSNVAKGQWPTLTSPLRKRLVAKPEPRSLPAREPLIRPEPVFDAGKLQKHVEFLSSARLEGRGIGTDGLSHAAEYVAAAFKRVGLQPGAPDGTYFQSWTERGPSGQNVELKNVVAVLEGSRTDWAQQSVVVGAHYDHLGMGWPDHFKGNKDKLHPGADDNASGIAVLIELGRVMKAQPTPERSIVFVAFTAEEWDLRGSQHYVKHMSRWPAKDITAMLNMDSVGRLDSSELSVLGSASADEWVHIVRGIGYTTGVKAKTVMTQLITSDHNSFHDAGVPAVQLFTGAHADYHRPSDTADKVDSKGMVKVAVFARVALNYLAGRPDTLTSQLDLKRSHDGTSTGPKTSRKVSSGESSTAS